MFSPRPVRFAVAALVVAIACVSPRAGAADRGVLLPIQDRVGDPATAALVRDTFRLAVSGRIELIAGESLRSSLRRSRIRDAGAIHPARAVSVAEELGAEWFVSLTLHRVEQGPPPFLAVSGSAFRVGDQELVWAGFRAASGLDGRKAFNRGLITDLTVLADVLARLLADDLVLALDGSHRAPDRRRPARDGYLESPVTPADLGPVAVLPFEAVAGPGSLEAADAATAVARSELHRRGVRLVHPGVVLDTMRRRDVRRKGLDPLSRSAIGNAGDARWMLAGTVEAFVLATGTNPDPVVAIGARLVETETGRIHWIGGREMRGSDLTRAFESGGVYSTGALAEIVFGTLIDGFLRGDGSEAVAERN